VTLRSEIIATIMISKNCSKMRGRARGGSRKNEPSSVKLK